MLDQPNAPGPQQYNTQAVKTAQGIFASLLDHGVPVGDAAIVLGIAFGMASYASSLPVGKACELVRETMAGLEVDVPPAAQPQAPTS